MDNTKINTPLSEVSPSLLLNKLIKALKDQKLEKKESETELEFTVRSFSAALTDIGENGEVPDFVKNMIENEKRK